MRTRILASVLALACLRAAAATAGEAGPVNAGALRRHLQRAFPGARVTADPDRGLRRLAGLALAQDPRGPDATVESVRARLAPVAWPVADLRAGAARVRHAGARVSLDAPLLLDGLPVVDALLAVEVRQGRVAAVTASLPPVASVDRTPWTLADDDARRAACLALRDGAPGRPCATGAAVARCWWRSADGVLRPGARVALPSPGRPAALEALVDNDGTVQWIRDRARR